MTRTIPNPPTNIAGYDPTRAAGDCTWDGEAAARAVDFFPEVLTHPDDSPTTRAGQPFALQPWQADFVATLFGWKRPDGTRRFTEAMVPVPRKNGKTALAAGIALFGLCAEARPSSQIYSAAMDRDQASAIYRTASRMAKQNPALLKRLNCVDSTKRITYNRLGSFYEALSGDADTGHSRKPFFVLFDELHTQKTRKLYDNLRTGMGSSINRLFASITTAGHDRHSICWEVWQHARKVRDGFASDPYFLPCIYELPEGAAWDDEEVWHLCNPNLGVSISLDFLREECQRAKDSPAYENTFRNLYLNQWTEQACRWLSMDKWRACGTFDPEELAGAPCWGGLDLSTTTDLSALVLAFRLNDGSIALLCRFWAPEEGAKRRAQRDRAPYLQWAKDGLLTLTPGDTVDYDAIRAEINELHEHYNIQEIAVDRWNASQLTAQLTGDGLPMLAHGQGYASMSAPAKEFEKLVIAGNLRHGGNEVLTWCAANVAVEQDAAGNVKPSKAKSTERIDGIVAAVMAVGRAAASEPMQSWSREDGVCL